MKRNEILYATELFFKSIIIIIAIAIVSIVFIFVHSSFSPKSYNKLTVDLKNGSILSYNSTTPSSPDTYEEWEKNEIKLIYFNKLTTSSKLFILFHLIFTSIFYILILKELMNFIKSVKDYTSFHLNNSNYFNRIGKYFSFLFVFQIVSTINSVSIKFSNNLHTETFAHFNLSPFIFYTACILLCFTISQVFKEGEQLKIENELTI